MAEHTFFLAVAPKAAARTRATCRGKFAQVYTAPAYRAWLEEAVPALKALAPTGLAAGVKSRPIRLTVEARFKRPKTTKLAHPRADNDNVEKGLWDAMTKVGAWWNDDVQVVENETVRRWAEPDEEPGYQVRVEYLSE